MDSDREESRDIWALRRESDGTFPSLWRFTARVASLSTPERCFQEDADLLVPLMAVWTNTPNPVHAAEAALEDEKVASDLRASS